MFHHLHAHAQPTGHEVTEAQAKKTGWVPAALVRLPHFFSRPGLQSLGQYWSRKERAPALGPIVGAAELCRLAIEVECLRRRPPTVGGAAGFRVWGFGFRGLGRGVCCLQVSRSLDKIELSKLSARVHKT